MSEHTITKILFPGKGVSSTFRNWRATHSKCSRLHGHDLQFQVTFACAREHLDPCGWVVDFGALDPLRERINTVFDHKVLCADDDPEKDHICALAGYGVADVVVLPHIGCEHFSVWLAVEATHWLQDIGRIGAVRVVSAHVYEHYTSNAAGYHV